MITEENSPNVLILGKNNGLNLKTKFEFLQQKKARANQQLRPLSSNLKMN